MRSPTAAPRPRPRPRPRAQPATPARLARLRQGAYRLFSQSLLYPEAHRLADLAGAAEELSADERPWADFSFFPQWRRFLLALRGLHDQEPATLQGTYVATFLAAQERVPCPLSESAYLRDSLSDAGLLLAELEQEYAKAGLAPSPTLRESPDHIAVQLEFMSLLCSREAGAWEDGNLPGARGALASQRGFLQRHLARWAPVFSRQVAAFDGSGLFAVVASATEAFVTHDRDLAEALMARIPEPVEADV